MLIHRVFNRFQRTCFPSERQKTVKKWHADGGDRRMRFDYDLDDSSLVLDLGGYEGQWASEIFSRYCCSIVIFEPVNEFAESIKQRFRHNPKICVVPFGVGRGNRRTFISLCRDSSSIFKNSGRKDEIKILDIAEWMKEESVSRVDLMKVNIEGGEYELLERLIEVDLVRSIRNIQVQFHEIARDSRSRMERIQEHLERTHSLTYQYPFVWENWRLK